MDRGYVRTHTTALNQAKQTLFWIRFVLQKLSQLLGDDENLQDEVFPNNWFSTHSDGRVVLYPMKVPSRAAEIRFDIVETVRRCILRMVGGEG